MYTGEPALPCRLMFWKVEVALALKLAEVLASMVRVPVVLAEAPKRTDWSVLLPLPLVLVMVRLLNALVPVMVPVAVCAVSPLKVTVLLPAVKVPELG